MDKPKVQIEDRRGKHRRGCKNPNAGRKKGSVVKVPQDKIDKALQLEAEGVSKFQIAVRLNLGVYVLNRILRENKNADSSIESLQPKNEDVS